MDFQCKIETVYSEGTSDGNMYVEIKLDSSEADEIFGCIKEYVDHDDMMNCLTEEEVIEHFGIEVKDD